MTRFYSMRTWQALLLLGVLETLCIGVGMGVPVFAILLGFPVGWWLARRHAPDGRVTRAVLRRVWTGALVPASMTLAFMLVIWAPKFSLLSEPGFDAAEWGIPLVLYTSRASFFGWMGLMIVVSPSLQLLATVFGAYATLLVRAPE